MYKLVVRNALKKISISYTKISFEEIIRKINMKDLSQDMVQSFMTKNRNFIENFNIDGDNIVF